MKIMKWINCILILIQNYNFIKCKISKITNTTSTVIISIVCEIKTYFVFAGFISRRKQSICLLRLIL